MLKILPVNYATIRSLNNQKINFKGNFQEPAQDTFQSSKSKQVTKEQMLYTVGNSMLKQGRYWEAIKNYNQALLVKPEGNAFSMRGIAKIRMANEARQKGEEYTAMGFYSSALSDLREGYRMKQNKNVLAYIAKAQMGLRNYKSAIATLEECIQHYEQVLATNPEDTKIKVKLYDLHMKKGICHRAVATSKYSPEVSVAFQEFTKALEFNPNSDYALYRRALVNPSFKSAAEDIEKAISINPYVVKYYDAAGSIYSGTSDLESIKKGVEYIAQAVSLRHQQQDN